MPLTTGVTPAAVAIALGVAAPSSAVEAQWQMWISDSLMLIQARADALGIEDLDQARLDYVIRESVASHVKQPDAVTQVTVAVDDASTSRQYSASAGRVSISDLWWDLLGLTAVGGRAFEVDTWSGAAVNHSLWCSLVFGGYCSCGADIAGYSLWG